MMTFPCPEGDCPSERVHRPYAAARGKNRKPSVSEFTDMIYGGGEGLVFYGAGEAAAVSYWQRDQLAEMPLEDAVTKVRNTVAAMRKTDADLGTFSHSAFEQFAAGEGWTEPTTYENGRDIYDYDRARLWEFVGGGARWFEKREPVALASEFIVADPLYVGTGDNISVIGDVVSYIDYKTHRRYKDDEKAAYGKWWLQGQMLATAPSLRHYHLGKLVCEVPWEDTGLPRPEQIMVVSIGPAGEVREYRWPVVDRAEIQPLILSLSVALAFKAPTPLQALIPKYEPRPNAPVDVEAML